MIIQLNTNITEQERAHINETLEKHNIKAIDINTQYSHYLVAVLKK
jgi:hypothetical protein